MKVAIEADFLYSYSTIDGKYSLRDEQTGSLYIQTLCDLIEREPHEELSLLLVDVNNAISKFKTQMPLIPTYDSRLRKRFYLARQQTQRNSKRSSLEKNQKFLKEKSILSDQNVYMRSSNLQSSKQSLFEAKNRLFNSNISMDTSKTSANNTRKVNVGKFSLLNTNKNNFPNSQQTPPRPSSSSTLMYTSVSNRSASFSTVDRNKMKPTGEFKIQPPKVTPKKSASNNKELNITVS